MHAVAIESIADIVGKAKIEGAKIGSDRHSLQFDTVDLRRPTIYSVQKKKKKSRNRMFLGDCLLVHFAIEAEPPGKRPCMRQTTLFGQVVGKNEDTVHSHLPYITPIVDHTFV